MAATELFFDLTNQYFVQAVATPNQINGPIFYADDVKPILLKLVRRTSPAAVEVVDLTGITAQVGLGTPSSSPTVITSATSGSVNGDGFLEITLPFNVAGVQTALGVLPQITPTFEIRVIDGATPNRYQTGCTLKQRLLTGALVDIAAPDVATSLAEVLSVCVPRDGSNATYPCSSFVMLDEEDPTKLYRFSIRAGQPHAEALN